MPAAPVHHTDVDETGSWDGPAEVKSFDKKASDFKLFYAWIDEGEDDKKADGTDKADGWGPHHEVNSAGKPGDANLKGVEAAMAALNGARGGNSRIPDGDRQAVWDHLAAHYEDGGVAKDDIPALAARSLRNRWDDVRRATPPGSAAERSVDSMSFGDIQSLVYQALCVKLGDEAEDKAADIDFWINDLSDEWVVYHVYGGADLGDWKLSYSLDDNDVVTFSGDPQAVVAQTEYVPAPEANAAQTGGATRDAAPETADPDDWTCSACGIVNRDAEVCSQCGGTQADMATAVSGVGAAAENAEDAEVTNAGITDPTAAAPENLGDDGRAKAPVENLVRFRPSGPAAPAVLLRDDGSAQSGTTMFGYFSTFNDWYEIDSYWEGTFLERVAPGAYSKTIAEDRSSMRVLYDHGFDPQLGNKPLGPINVLREDSVGPYYEVPLLDTDYNRNFLAPALRGQLMSGEAVGSQLGASFRFIVTGESWDYSGEITSFNPLGLPLRTITATQVMEFGPVTFPANDLATAGARSACRSTTDSFIRRLQTDPLAVARFTERTSLKVVERVLAMPPSTTRRDPSNTTQPTSGDAQAGSRASSYRLRARLALADH